MSLTVSSFTSCSQLYASYTVSPYGKLFFVAYNKPILSDSHITHIRKKFSPSPYRTIRKARIRDCYLLLRELRRLRFKAKGLRRSKLAALIADLEIRYADLVSN